MLTSLNCNCRVPWLNDVRRNGHSELILGERNQIILFVSFCGFIVALPNTYCTFVQ